MKKSEIRTTQELFWAVVPLLWGIYIWLFGFGVCKSLLTFLPWQLSYVLRITLPLSLIIWKFKNQFNHNRLFPITACDIKIPTVPWEFFVSLIICSLSFLLIATPFIDIQNYPALEAFLFGVVISSIIEEFIARPLFVAFKISKIRFLILNSISSLAFTFMHLGYYHNWAQQISTLARWGTIPIPGLGHFLFSFMLSTIAYQTKRIEWPLLFHILSNATWWTQSYYQISIYGVHIIIGLFTLKCAYNIVKK
jgi:membrane protease YdiL (CAAX protease family)